MLIVFGGLMLIVFGGANDRFIFWGGGGEVCKQVHLQCRIHKRDVFGISI